MGGVSRVFDLDGGRCFDSALPIATGEAEEVCDRERECADCAYSLEVEAKCGGVGVNLGVVFFPLEALCPPSLPERLCETSRSLSLRLGVDGALSLFPIIPPLTRPQRL